jgi:hypothetical protein
MAVPLQTPSSAGGYWLLPECVRGRLRISRIRLDIRIRRIDQKALRGVLRYRFLKQIKLCADGSDNGAIGTQERAFSLDHLDASEDAAASQLAGTRNFSHIVEICGHLFPPLQRESSWTVIVRCDRDAQTQLRRYLRAVRR